MRTLKRRATSGFVTYPHDVPKRIHDGCARFRTRCDHIVGPCACGYVHQENDRCTEETLEANDLELDTFVLTPDVKGEVRIPRYWNMTGTRHATCTHLIGQCACGRIHGTPLANWVLTLLTLHKSTIAGHITPRMAVSEVSFRYPTRHKQRAEV